MSEVPQFVKRLESRIALALARAQAAFDGVASGRNHAAASTSIAVVANLLVFLNSFTPTSGKVRVWVAATLDAGGGTLVAGDQITCFIQRDGAVTVGPVQFFTVPTGGPANGVGVSQVWDDTTTAGVAHSYACVCQASGGHTMAAVNIQVIVQELPA